jgi:hypothetical protein
MAKQSMPKTLGATIDLLWSLREERKVAEASVKEIKDKEAAVEAHLMNNFERSGLNGAKGKYGLATLKVSTVADVTDWPAFHMYIGKQKAWDLLQQRASITALRARWDAGKEVPGVTPKEIITLSLTQVKQ